MPGLSWINEIPSFIETWLPLMFFLCMVAIVYLLWRTLQMMPRVKPTHTQAGSRESVALSEVAGQESCVPAADTDALAARMQALWSDAGRRQAEGEASLARAREWFGRGRFTRASLATGFPRARFCEDRSAGGEERSLAWRLTSQSRS